jgi:signal transduction histidine kinase
VGVGGLVRRLRQGKAGPLSEPQLAYLETIGVEMENLEKLINNFLEFIRLDLHILTPLPSALQVDKECQEVITLLSPLAEAKSINLRGEYPQEILVLQADPLLFRRVLENLLGNAVKYSPPKTTVILKVQDKGEEVLFAVQDQGPGILPADLPHLFEIYYRGAEGGKERGFGLGLATVKRIIEIHGARTGMSSGRVCKTPVPARVMESPLETILDWPWVRSRRGLFLLRMKSVAGDEGLKAVSLQGLPAPLQPLGPVDANRIVPCVFPLSCR